MMIGQQSKQAIPLQQVSFNDQINLQPIQKAMPAQKPPSYIKKQANKYQNVESVVKNGSNRSQSKNELENAFRSDTYKYIT